jgi:ABC-type branched-subunit amino acid transport system substrate-binding protein
MSPTISFRNLLRRACVAIALALAPGALTADGARAAEGDAGAPLIAVTVSLSGEEAPYGRPILEGAQLAIEEANAAGGPQVALAIEDDGGDIPHATEAAKRIAAGRAAVAIGPAFSFISLATGPIYADAHMASLPTTATADSITRNATTFRVIFKNSEQGELLATYLARVLGLHRARVIAVDDGYGQTLRDGFDRAATALGITARYATFKTPEEAERVAREVAADPERPPVVLLMLDADAARVLTVLRRGGMTGPFLGGDALGDEILSERLKDETEEKRSRGWFTDNLYAVSPVNFDSANAETLQFLARFRARFGHEPAWQSATGYDGGRLAVAAVRAALASGAGTDTAAMRSGVLRYLGSLDSPAHAIEGLLGPIWFDREHGRPTPIRIGRFSGGHFESAPIQIVPVDMPAESDIASGAVFTMTNGRSARLQRVVYTGVYINEIPRIDVTRSSFGADFYVWLRFAGDAGRDSPDPTDIVFPNLISGSFDHAKPAEQGEMPDGTQYRLWRVQGEFLNEFDLHRFPFDRQRLSLPFYNARGAADRIVYALDRRSTIPGGEGRASSGAAPLPIASPEAFRNLTLWDTLGASERRENLVTDSSLGDPRRTGAEGYRELSGFVANVDVRRRALATLAKNLMPLMLMTLIIYTTLHFPPALVKEKVVVAVTGALSGAVLLTAINSQLGGVGYTIAVEYAFFVFFGLTTVSIVAALTAEHYRAKHPAIARMTERGTRVLFLLAIIGLLGGAWWLSGASAAEVAP